MEEVAGLSVIDGGEVYYLDQTESSSDIQLRDWTGEHAPLHAVPSGLVLLAHLPDDQQEAYLSQPLAHCTPWTTVDPNIVRGAPLAGPQLGVRPGAMKSSPRASTRWPPR